MIFILKIIIGIALGIELTYELVFMFQIRAYKRSLTCKPIHHQQAVSVIVCVHNELANLQRLIPLIQKQDYPNFEIIVVDDRSDDGTYDYLLGVQSEQLKLVHVKQVYDHINPKKYAITLGVKVATHDILLFTDADCYPTTNLWIQAMTNQFDDTIQFVLGVSQYQQETSLLSTFIRFETLKTAINYVGFGLAGNPYMGVGRNMAYRKSFFLKHKGFNKFQHITGGDDDLFVNRYANKLNTRIALGHNALNYSLPKQSWRAYTDQKIRHWSVGKYYQSKDKWLLGIQNLTRLIFWVALIILAFPIKTIYYPLGLLFFRLLVITKLNIIAAKKFGDRINYWMIPIMDIVYVGYATLIGTVALMTKKIKWKT